MKNRDQDVVAQSRAMSRAFCDSILDASDDELREALDEGEDLEDLAKRGQQAIDRAFEQVLGTQPSRVDSGAESEDVEDLHKGLGICIQLLRRKKRLSEEELARKARVSADEIRRMEFDPTFTPKPRTLAQLEDFFKLKPKSLGVLSGAIRVQEGGDAFRQGVRRFAALSSGIGRLSREERRLLAEVFKLIDEHTE